jgi:proline dehydrogenase
MLSRNLVLKVSGWKPVERLIRSRLFRPFVRRFVPGETVPEAIAEAERLVADGYFVSLDYLGENVKTHHEAQAAAETYASMLGSIAASPCSHNARCVPVSAGPAGGALSQAPCIERTNISIKLTQCGLDLGDDVAESHYRKVVQMARDLGNFVRVDMEGSDYTVRTIRVVERVFADLGHTGTVLQSYLHRTPQDVEWAIERGIRLRLVKGAYLEPPEIAYQEKSRVDDAFFELAKRLLEDGVYPAFATHDPQLIERIRAHAEAKGYARDRFEFQMLFGIRRDLQAKLLGQGYNVRVYIPFGESWYPYFSRRLAERPANILFLLKSLFHR